MIGFGRGAEPAEARVQIGVDAAFDGWISCRECELYNEFSQHSFDIPKKFPFQTRHFVDFA